MQSNAMVFQELIEQLARASDGVCPADGAGLKFGSQEHVGRVFIHPRWDDKVVIEIAVTEAYQAPVSGHAPLWQVLHSLNHACRFEHGWVVSLDEDDTLVLSTLLSLTGLQAYELKEWMADGVQRAAHLMTLWPSLVALAPPPPEVPLSAYSLRA